MPHTHTHINLTHTLFSERSCRTISKHFCHIFLSSQNLGHMFWGTCYIWSLPFWDRSKNGYLSGLLCNWRASIWGGSPPTKSSCWEVLIYCTIFSLFFRLKNHSRHKLWCRREHEHPLHISFIHLKLKIWVKVYPGLWQVPGSNEQFGPCVWNLEKTVTGHLSRQ